MDILFQESVMVYGKIIIYTLNVLDQSKKTMSIVKFAINKVYKPKPTNLFTVIYVIEKNSGMKNCNGNQKVIRKKFRL